MILIVECATSHGGDVDLAADMIRAAADAGATMAKLQSYSLVALNQADPQRDWLVQAHLDTSAHERLLKVGEDCGIQVFSTPFDRESLQMLRELGLKTFKIASSESGNTWWRPRNIAPPFDERWFVSYPWGDVADANYGLSSDVRLTAIPVYPTPLEAVGRATLLDGWSDHTEGIVACQWAIAQGARVLEVHIKLPGRSRERCWDKTPQEVRQVRDFADACLTITSGVGQVFRDRWKRA